LKNRIKPKDDIGVFRQIHRIVRGVTENMGIARNINGVAENQRFTMCALDLPKTNHSQPRFDVPALLLEAIVQSSEDAIITKDLNGIITSWNPAAVRIFGYTPDEMVGQSILKLIPPSLHDEEQMILSKLRRGEQIAHFETTRRAKDGHELTVSLTISPLKDKTGRVVGVSKIARDITHQKQLDDVRFRLAAIVESSDDAILSKNLSGIIMSWNQAAERIFGYSEQEIVGASIMTLIPEDLRSEEETILRKIQSGERIDHFETVRINKKGDRLAVSLTISPLKDSSGKVVGASKVLRDVTARKRLEQSLLQAEKIAATGKMAATIAHEINNPLESVLNLIYLAKTNVYEPDQVVNFLETAETELVRVSHIAKQTLGYYREHSAAVKVTLHELVGDTLKIYAPKMTASGIQIQTNFSSSARIVLRQGEMRQVISNLVTNAMHAMPLGGTLTVYVQDATESGKPGLLLSVEDTGEGIASTNLEKIFEPFFTTRGAVGTGIGLWVTKQFIEGHKGRIGVQSSVDAASHGTRVSVFLPIDNPYAT
jgi:PAS domain S-box-containing protein